MKRTFRLLLTASLITCPWLMAKEKVTSPGAANLSLYNFDASYPDQFIRFDGLVYFRARTDENWSKYFQTDGTPEGTVEVTGLSRFPSFSSNIPYVWQEQLYLSDGEGLWKITGANAQPTKIGNSGIVSAQSTPDRLFFHDEGNIFTYDGTAAEVSWLNHLPILVSQLDTVSDLILLNDTLFVLTSLENQETKLIAYETNASAQVYIPLSGVSGRGTIKALGDRVLVFVGKQLWVSDGTKEGTILTHTSTNSFTSYDFVASSTHVWFAAGNNQSGYELWRSDGTNEGTGLYHEFIPGAGTGLPRGLTVLDDRLLLFAEDEEGKGLFVVDDLNQPPQLVSRVAWDHLNLGDPFYPEEGVYVENNERIYFSGVLGEQAGIWSSDGTPEGTRFELKTRHTLSLIPYKDGYVVEAQLGSGGVEPWFVQQETQRLLGDLNQGEFASRFQSDWSVTLKNRLIGLRVERQVELWSSDGNQMEVIKRFPLRSPTEPYTFDPKFTRMGDLALFQVWDAEYGVEWWRTDGTAEGTSLLKDLEPGNTWAGKRIVSADHFFFRTMVFRRNQTLYRSDGTNQGTIPLLELQRILFFDMFGDGKGGLFMMVSDENKNLDLFYLDKDEDAFLTLVEDLSELIETREVKRHLQFNDLTFFEFGGVRAPSSLWCSDGTPEGTLELAGNLQGFSWTTLNDRVLFSGIKDGSFYFASSDGHEVNQIPFEAEAAPSFWAPNSGAYAHLLLGNQLYKSDGTAAGTTPLGSIEGNIQDANFMMQNDSHGILATYPHQGSRTMTLWRMGLESHQADNLGTVHINSILMDRGDTQVLAETLYFNGALNEDGPSTLCRVDLAQGGVSPVNGLADIHLQPFNLNLVDDQLMFLGTHPIQGTSLWSLEQQPDREEIPVQKRVSNWFPDICYLSVPKSEGASYQWLVEGATILSGENSHRLRVRLPKEGKPKITVIITLADGTEQIGYVN